MSAVIIPIALDVSDGTGATPSTSTALPYVRNDQHYLTKIAEHWAKQDGMPKGASYRLERLPSGYSGWEKARSTDKGHVDRYVYGHPKGIFRSINEFYPHLRHLQDMGGPVGCNCKLCSGKKSQLGSDSNSVNSGSPSEKSSYFAAPDLTANGPTPTFQTKAKVKPKKMRPESPIEERPRQADVESIPDYYRILLDEIKAAGPEGTGFRNFQDRMSPDWRAGNEMLANVLGEWSAQPSYLPRCGELVLFTRSVSPDEGIAWHIQSQCLRRIDRRSMTWLDRPKWEVGVVTQLPLEPLSTEDLECIPRSRKQGIASSGYRVEPLNQPGKEPKSSSGQHKYVPLHAIRSFACWQDCIGTNEEEWHPTLKHALTVASSVSVVGKFVFQGVWPSATLFVRGIYLGPDLILLGDAVRIASTPAETRPEKVTDVMVVSAIRLRFVNLDEANDDDYDDGRPYNTCLHVAGKIYSLDPKRSFGGIGRSPVKANQQGFPSGLSEYGTWFHVNDPTKPKEKMEVPYARVLGKCLEHNALQALFSTPKNMAAGSNFQAVNNGTPMAKPKRPTLSHGVRAIHDARAFSYKHDDRIDKEAGKVWFWAETRIEQLDLHEINGKFVGVKDDNRTRQQVHAWKQALKVLDGKRGGLEDYHAALKQREEEKRRESGVVSSGFGMMATAGQEDSATDAEALDGAEMMDIDEEPVEDALASQLMDQDQGEMKHEDVIVLD